MLAGRLGDHVQERSSREFVGRADELATLREWTRPAHPPSVVFVHGPPGIGKTALVSALTRGLGAGESVLLAGREVEPTPASILAALAARAGADEPTAGSVAVALAARCRCLVFDDAERLRLVDDWLRSELLPALPATITTLLVGRTRPLAPWLVTPGWHGLVASLEVPPLTAAEAADLLDTLAVDDTARADIMRLSRGHPLALRLAAAAPAATGFGEPAGLPVVVEHLVDRLLDGVPPTTVRLLQAATAVRRVTEGDLAGLAGADGLPGTPHEWWSALRDLPFCTLGEEGLEIHDVVREAVQRSLAGRDPERHAALRRRAVATVSARVARSEPAWSGTADLLYLVRDPVVREGFFPSDPDPVPVEAARPGDRTGVGSLLAIADGPEAAGLVETWLDTHPGSVRVARAPAGAVAGFATFVERADTDPWLLRKDPVAAEWARHLDRHPVGSQQKVLFVRRALGSAGDLPSPALAALFVDVKRTYLELRPRLRRVYVAAPPGAAAEMCARLGFEPVGGDVRLDGVVYRVMVLDFGPASVDGWLARLLDVDVGTTAGAAPSPLDTLTVRERQVLALVAEGATNRAIAAELGISSKTVGRHLENVFTKLDVTNRAAAARLAAVHGLERSALRV